MTSALMVLTSTGGADQAITSSGVEVRPGNIVDTLLMEAVGSKTTAIDSSLNQADDFWVRATLTVIQDNSSLTDSTRTITGWNQSTHTLTFSAWASDSLEDNDSVTISLPTSAYQTEYTNTIALDSTGTDTTEIYTFTPGASITSQHLITYDSAGTSKDSVDTKIVLLVSVKNRMPTGAGAFHRADSITYASVDTTVYKAWGALQGNYIMFELSAVAAPHTKNVAIHYGFVMADK